MHEMCKYFSIKTEHCLDIFLFIDVLRVTKEDSGYAKHALCW